VSVARATCRDGFSEGSSPKLAADNWTDIARAVLFYETPAVQMHHSHSQKTGHTPVAVSTDTLQALFARTFARGTAILALVDAAEAAHDVRRPSA